MDNTLANKASDNIRILAASMVEKAGSGHPGGAMGGADFVNVLYSEFLNYDPKDPSWINRDRFFLDPGHMSPMLYGILALTGKYTMDEVSNFRQWDSPTPGHPEVDITRGVENTSGPLGQGHVMAVGAAIAERFLVAKFGEWMAHKTYTYISDGGVQEEISQGAGRLAGHLGLGNLIMFYDSNDIQLSTTTKEVTGEDTEMKYKAWGWHVVKIDGNDPDAIRKALKESIAVTDKPSIIIGKTIMGKGARTAEGDSFEGKCATHGMPLSKCGASYDRSIENLGGNPADPFQIFPEVATAYAKVNEEKEAIAADLKAKQATWTAANPELAKKLDSFFALELPDIDYSAIEQKEGIATRTASKAVLAVLADNVENMIVASADLSNSDNTDGFLAKTQALTKGDFSGQFLQMGVAELTMAVVANGLALHGGVFAACATFFVFSDYMKPAVRLAALQQLPVKYIWTHDAFRVGEDGPTHQPVEQEAQIRLMEQLKNHAGDNSLLALRPADAVETTVAWEMAMKNKKTPTALILSRQNIKDLPTEGGTRYEAAVGSKKGGYIVKSVDGTPDIVFVGNGSEVSTLIEGAAKLEAEKGVKVQVSSIPSEGLFRSQDAAYQATVLPQGITRLGLTAGLPVTLAGLVGENGKVIGLDHFGYSAPAGVLDEKLGYTPENVFNNAVELLG